MMFYEASPVKWNESAMMFYEASPVKWNESAMILSAFDNRLSLVHCANKNSAVKQNKNIKWSKSP